MRHMKFSAYAAATLLACVVPAVAQTNQGPIQQPHADATSTMQPGKPGPGQPQTLVLPQRDGAPVVQTDQPQTSPASATAPAAAGKSQ